MGNNEPDYYAESLTKRIFGAAPSVANALQMPDFADMSKLPLAKLVGTYRRDPVENSSHEVTLSLNGGNLRWSNAAGSNWNLLVLLTELWSAANNL